MAILHQAEIVPSKRDMVAKFVAGREWAGDLPEDWERIAAYRFDDPAGEVGIETMLIGTQGGPVLQVPLTYRGAPLEGADEWLIGTAEHSVLGTRWFYDAAGDPVYAQMLATTILGGGREADQFYPDGTPIEGTAQVRGSGSSADLVGVPQRVEATTAGSITTISADGRELLVARRVGDELSGVTERLTGTWADQSAPVTLAGIR
ncbi:MULTISPECIES: hypothetical protein [unclassified Cryobacterium]|uniref:CG0192-related protein n=1 Tax=unclassified Cryobacterium TaxID=2649013 RepID=UPI001445D725|nr:MULTISPECIES: hypothetical protein [unclassified Cryobacterium]